MGSPCTEGRKLSVNVRGATEMADRESVESKNEEQYGRM